MDQHISPAFLRARIAEADVPIYVLAGRVRLHPTHLGKILHGRAPLKADLAARILEAIELPEAS